MSAHTLTSADGTEFSAYLARAEGPDGRRRPARRARPVPLLRGARGALRRRRPPGDRGRLLRPHRRPRPARRGLRVPAARRADARPRHVALDVATATRLPQAPDRHRTRDHRRLLLRRRAVVHAGRRGPRRPGRRGRLLRLAREPRDDARGYALGDRPRPGREGPGARPVRRRRRAHHSPIRSGPSTRRCRSSTRSTSTKARRTRSSTAAHEQYAEASNDAWERILGFYRAWRRRCERAARPRRADARRRAAAGTTSRSSPSPAAVPPRWS